MRLEQRLLNLERIAEDAEPPIHGVVLFRYGETLTDEQQLQVEDAKANGQPVIIFRVVDASITEEI
jgi:hypothetical protein